jgi:hypothetical protein
MRVLASSPLAWFIVLFVLLCANDACACKEHVRRARQQQSFCQTGIKDQDFGSAAGIKSPRGPVCHTPTPSKEQVLQSRDRVRQFYDSLEHDPGWERRLETIVVDVNFVVVTNTAGEGVLTREDVEAQIVHLSSAFFPQFSFNLKYFRIVTSNRFFFLDADNVGGPDETDMKAAYKQGGRETLSVYSLTPVSANELVGGWAFLPDPDAGVLDGVVMAYYGVPVPGGYNPAPYYSEGDVSKKFCVSLFSVWVQPSTYLCSFCFLESAART